MKFDGMMASVTNMFTARFLIYALFFIYVASIHSQTEGGFRLYEGKRLIRIRRDVCVDGTYEYNNRNCCLCGAGYKLIEHCISSPDDRTCEPCEENTYNSHPNFQKLCEPCTECSSKANLEVHESCGPATNTKCRCKNNHFCKSDTEQPCKLCFPCKDCGADGIKAPCTTTNDTVCNDKSEGGNTLPIILGILFTGLFIAIIVAGVCWIKRKRMRQQNITRRTNGTEELRPLKAPRVDLTPHLPDIAEVIGWNDMEAVALRVGIPNTTIDACKLDYPGQSQQQTQQLLKTWVENQGMEASGKLINILQNSGKRGKAEKVVNILLGGSGATSHVSA